MMNNSRPMLRSQTVDLSLAEMPRVKLLSTTKIKTSQRLGREKKAIILKSNLRNQDLNRLLLLTRISLGKILKARNTIRKDS